MWNNQNFHTLLMEYKMLKSLWEKKKKAGQFLIKSNLQNSRYLYNGNENMFTTGLEYSQQI